MSAQRPVLVDTDTGVDDALALLTVLASDQLDVVGIGTSYGNCPVDLAARNARCVLEVADRPEIPVALGLPQPENSSVPAAAEVHGADGLGNQSWTPSIPTSREGAVEQLLRLSHEHAGHLELLVLGPLSNIAAALDQDPQVLARCARVVIMGGMGLPARAPSIARLYPNYDTVGDPNTWHNPGAAHTVAAAAGPVSWVGMDVTGRVHLPEALLTDAAAEHPTGRFVAAITGYYCAYVTRSSHAARRVFTIHDTIAANVLLQPAIALCSTRTAVDVDYSRDPRGGIWATPAADRPQHHVVGEIDLPSIVDRLAATLTT